jgi:NADPH-dependent ferric siderophore reductase
MTQAKFREVIVADTQRLTENMHRVCFQGESLTDFPVDSNGGYFKLLFHPETRAAIKSEAELESLGTIKPTLRTYSVRAFNPVTQTLVVDFVLHGEHGEAGPASNWAVQCQVGDTIVIRGPAPAKMVNADADQLMIVGDMTALPAISANLEQLPAEAKGVAIIQINSSADKQALTLPDGIQLVWVDQSQTLLDTVKNYPWPEGVVSVWAACEFLTMRELRNYFKQTRNVSKENMYVSSYWKQGHTEEQHKVIKRQDAEESQV